jgi:hypothetical protein
MLRDVRDGIGVHNQRPMSGARAALLALLLYLALAVAATWPLGARAADHVYGLGTPPLNVWAMAWVRHQLPRDPLHLFDANAFHPYRHSLAFSEHLLVPTLLGLPVASLTGNDVLAHNVVEILSLALAGLGAFLLARALTADPLASVGAGVLYAFHTWNINELIRIQIVSNQWFPFLLHALLRYFRAPSWPRAGAAAGFALLQAWSGMYWALYLPLLVVPAAAFLQWRHRLPLRALRPLLAALAVTAVAGASLLVPYVATARTLGFARPAPPPVALDRYLDVLPGNALAGLLGIGRPNENAAHFLGFAGMALGLCALLAPRRRLPPALAAARPLLAMLVLGGVLLSLGTRVVIGGHDLAPGPYAALRAWVPGFRNVRYPERFALFAVLGLAPLVAGALVLLRAWVGRAGVAALTALVFLEHLSTPLPLVPLPVGALVPAVYPWLRSADGVRVVAQVPGANYRMERAEAIPMYLSTHHWKRTVQGFTGYSPPATHYARWQILQYPAPHALRFLDRFGVDAVVVAPGAPLPPLEGSPWEIARRFEDGYAVLRHQGPRAAPFAPPADGHPGLSEVARAGWRVRASRPGAARALDGDPGTEWSTVRSTREDNYFRVVLPAPVRLARVSVAVHPPFQWPTGLTLSGLTAEGTWTPLPYDREAAYDGLCAWLLHRPRAARLDIDLAPTLVRGLRLDTRGDDFELPWTMAELRLYEPAAGYSAAGMAATAER